MAILNLFCRFGPAPLPMLDTDLNRKRVFVIASGSAASSSGSPFGNLGPRQPDPNQDSSLNLNNPIIPGTISVSGYSNVHFDSHDFTGDVYLAGNASYLIEAGYIQIELQSAPGVALTRTDIMAFV